MSGSNVPVQKECDIPGKSVYTIWRSDFEIDDKYVVRSSARSHLTPLSTFALLGARSSPANMHQHVHVLPASLQLSGLSVRKAARSQGPTPSAAQCDAGSS